MSDTVSQIKERLSVDEVLGGYIKLEKAGANFKALCPFHKEKTPSFLVSPSRGSYYCFGCGAKGDIFSFVESFEGLDFKGALEVLAKKANVPITNFKKQSVDGEKDRLFSCMEEACIFFEKELSKNKEALDYLRGRGLNDDSIKSFRIGFASKSWQDLKDYLVSKKYSQKEIVLLGLVKEKEDGKSYDRFRSRIMFPLFDLSGRVIAFSGRDFEPRRGEKEIVPAKYINSPETPLFSKGSVLYGLHKAKDHIREKGYSILVEGQMDLVMSHQCGFGNTVAASGTALLDKEVREDGSLNHLGVINRLANKVVLAYDTDKAGLKASARSTKIAFSLGMEVFIASGGEKGEDPADILKKDPSLWEKIIKERVPALKYFSDILVKSAKDRMDLARLVSSKLIPFIASIKSPILRQEGIKQVARDLKIDEGPLKEELYSFEEKEGRLSTEEELENKNKDPILKKQRKENIILRAIGTMLWIRDKEDSPIDPKEVEDTIKDILKEDYDFYLSLIGEIKEKILFSIEEMYSENNLHKWEVEELLSNLKEEILKEYLLKKKEEIKRAEDLDDDVAYKKLLDEYLDLGRQIEIERHKRIAL